MEKEYKLHSIEEYLKTSNVAKLPQEVKDEIVRVRTTFEFLPWSMYQLLLSNHTLKRSRRLSKPRSLWVSPDDGRVYYFCFYHSRFNYCAFFNENEEEIEELRKRDAEIAQKQIEKKERKIRHLEAQKKKREEQKKTVKPQQTPKKPIERFSFRELNKTEEVKPKRKRMIK